ncbi:unnamed protein product, partial [Ectocarpus sp. 6 AP-2014]
QQQGSVVAADRNAEEHQLLDPVMTSGQVVSTDTNHRVNLADEALYRHYPPVNPSSSGAASGGGSILDAANAYTFETLNRKLASTWCSPSLPSSSAATSCCPPQDPTTNNNNNAMKCLTDNSGNAAAGNTTTTTTRSPTPAAGGIPPTSRLRGGGGGAECGPGAAPTSQLLFLVRHGETDMNKAGRLQGRGVNAPLNGAGLDQAQGLGRFVRNVPFDTVTSSSLLRAHETAMRIAENNEMCLKLAQENGPVPPVPPSTSTKEQEGEKTTPADFCCGDKAQVRVRRLEGLDELSWGELQGEDSKLEPFKGCLAALKEAWDEGVFDRAAEGGENLVEVQARARAAVEAILDRGKELNLVVSHGRTLRILMLSLTGLGMDQMTNMGKIPNCGTYILEVRRSGPGAARSYRLLPARPS